MLRKSPGSFSGPEKTKQLYMLSYMTWNVVLLKIQGVLYHPKYAWKVSGFLRNDPQTITRPWIAGSIWGHHCCILYPYPSTPNQLYKLWFPLIIRKYFAVTFCHKQPNRLSIFWHRLHVRQGRHFVSGFPWALLSLSQETSSRFEIVSDT